MTAEQAKKILGVSDGMDSQEIKKNYHRLLHLVHPDASVTRGDHPVPEYTVDEIRLAYETLCGKRAGRGKKPDAEHKKDVHKNKKQKENCWNAPELQQAFRSRKIYQTLEDADGEVIGDFCVAEGKYFWVQDEEFPLFLKSTRLCGLELLEQLDREEGKESSLSEKQPFQAELTYQLTVQFIDSLAALAWLGRKCDDSGEAVYQLRGMVETGGSIFQNQKEKPLFPGEVLYPDRLSHHRLYLKKENGESAGMLSFPDDRLYYVVIPLFEQRSVQVKIQVAEGLPETGRSRRQSSQCQKLDLWIRFSRGGQSTGLNSQTLKIEEILEKYRRFLREKR